MALHPTQNQEQNTSELAVGHRLPSESTSGGVEDQYHYEINDSAGEMALIDQISQKSQPDQTVSTVLSDNLPELPARALF